MSDDQNALKVVFGPDSRELFHLTLGGMLVIAPDSTREEIATCWIQSLMQQPQQQSITHTVARWESGSLLAKLLSKPGETIAKVQKTETGLVVSFLIRLTDGKCRSFVFPAVIGEPVGERPDAWGLTQLGPGVWTVSPSFHAQGVTAGDPPGDLHTFITIVNVPEGAL